MKAKTQGGSEERNCFEMILRWKRRDAVDGATKKWVVGGLENTISQFIE